MASWMNKDEKNILITGFTSFPGVPINPCEEVLAWIEKTYSSEDVTTCLLPVSFSRSAKILADCIREISPVAVIELGVSSRTTVIRLESKGYNARTATIPDVDGIHCTSQVIDKTLPYDFAKRTIWPLDELAKALRETSRTEVVVSVDPGRYVCNSLYWETLHRFPEIPSIFVHIPPIDDINRSAIIQTVGELVDWKLSRLSRNPSDLA